MEYSNCFTRIQFLEDYIFEEKAIGLNLITGELSYSQYKIKHLPKDICMRNMKTGFQYKIMRTQGWEMEPVFTWGKVLPKRQIKQLLAYCKVNDFMPYRDGEPSIRDSDGYRDCWWIDFTGVSDSQVPCMHIHMGLIYADAPTEKLYNLIYWRYLSKVHN